MNKTFTWKLLKAYQVALEVQESLETLEGQYLRPDQLFLDHLVVHVVPAVPQVQESREVQSNQESLAGQVVLGNLLTNNENTLLQLLAAKKQ